MTQSIIVTHELTAEVMGSGSLPVYATPAVVALIEHTACQCISNLQAGETTVGTHIDVHHLKASAVGETVTCTATLVAQEGRKYSFTAEVMNAQGETIATATHERFMVDAERFMEKVATPQTT